MRDRAHGCNMADNSELLNLFGDDFDAILSILEDDEELEKQFNDAAIEVSL